MSIEIPTATTALIHGDLVNVDDRMMTVENIHRTPSGINVTLTDDKTKVETTIEVGPEDIDVPVWMVENE